MVFFYFFKKTPYTFNSSRVGYSPIARKIDHVILILFITTWTFLRVKSRFNSIRTTKMKANEAEERAER